MNASRLRLFTAPFLLAVSVLAATPKATDYFSPDYLESVLPPHILFLGTTPEEMKEGFDKSVEHLRQGRHVDLVAMKDPATPPIVVKQPWPRIRHRGRGDNYASLLALLNSHGDVVAIYVAATDDEDWAKACIASVAQWTYKPATFGGQAVPCLVCLSMHRERDR
jgi:hypothetical protein